jgi:hypothetical protein
MLSSSAYDGGADPSPGWLDLVTRLMPASSTTLAGQLWSGLTRWAMMTWEVKAMAGSIIAAVLVGVLAVTGITAGYWGLRQWTRSASRFVGLPWAQPEAEWLGAALTATVNIGWPLARLELFDWGIRLGSTARVFRWCVPTWEARYAELAVVRNVTNAIRVGTMNGLRFAVADSADAVVFWSTHSSEILDHLEAAGAIVDRRAVPLKRASGAYGTR